MLAKYLLGTSCALTLLISTQMTHAQTLSSLIGAGPVTSGGLVFSNFNETGTMPASSITVAFTSTGVQFTSGWTTVTPNMDSSIITYTVGTTSGTISGTTLDFSGTNIMLNAAASVGETVSDNNSKNVYNLQVFDGGAGNPNNSLSDTATFNPAVTSINIVKSIDVAAKGTGSFATLNFVENVYTGSGTTSGAVPPAVPEPMSLALIPLSLAALAARKKLAR